MKKPFQIKGREEGRGKPWVEKFATLAEAQTYIKDRWQGADYMDGISGFHTDASTYELIGFTLKDVGSIAWMGMWRDYTFTDFTQVQPQKVADGDGGEESFSAPLLPAEKAKSIAPRL